MRRSYTDLPCSSRGEPRPANLHTKAPGKYGVPPVAPLSFNLLNYLAALGDALLVFQNAETEADPDS